jgi:iron complex outermembrane receptor protein
MSQKLVLFNIVLLFFVVSTFHTTLAQNKTKKIVELSTLLEKISNDHKIFFTYDANLISDKIIQEDGFLNLSLKESISLLEKLTPFHFDDLGNNYYVMYSNKESLHSLKSKDAGIDSASDKIIVRGIVLSSDNSPLNAATLQDEKSLYGTTTNSDGTFEFIIQKENNTTVSFLGHNSKKNPTRSQKVSYHNTFVGSGIG